MRRYLTASATVARMSLVSLGNGLLDLPDQTYESDVAATVLVDGTVRGTWKLVLGKKEATLTVTLFERLSLVDRAEVEAEALRLLDFAAEDADRRDLVWA